MDGYIKSKEIELKKVKKNIFYKYLCTYVILIFILVFLALMATDQPPQQWEKTNITCREISWRIKGLERFRSKVIISVDGRLFYINNDIGDRLSAGKKYSIVYSKTFLGNYEITAIEDDETVYLSLDESIAQWEERRQDYIKAICITLCVEAAALIIIGKFWCKTDYDKIDKLKSQIIRRRNRAKDSKRQ